VKSIISGLKYGDANAGLLLGSKVISTGGNMALKLLALFLFPRPLAHA